MKGNLKVLGLALMAALALGAIGAQGASAVVEHSFRFGSANEKTVLTGHSETNIVFRTSTGGLAIECTTATFSGTNVGNIRDTITLHPKTSSCESAFGALTEDTGGCNYIFDSDTTTSTHSSSEEHAAVEIECETASHRILMTTGVCNLRFNPQVGIHGVRYINLLNHSGRSAVTVNLTLRDITFEALGGSLCGFAGLPAGLYHTGTIDGKFSMTGYEDIDNSPGSSTTNGTTWIHGQQVDISVSTPT